MKKKLCLVYQLFTKCNIGCKYCYNYFDQDVLPYDYYTSKVEKILELYDDETCFVLNGGEPLLLKDFDKLVNLATATARTYTYTNGTLGTNHYRKFIDSLENKNKFYMTISLHCKEVLKNNRLTDKYLKNVNLFAETVPNLKMNLVVDEEFQGEYLTHIKQAMRDIKEHTALKNLNILIADHMYNDEIKLLRILNKEFSEFVKELDENFTYVNCMWDNTRKTLTEMINDIKENTALKLAGKDFKIPYKYEFAQINFLESPKGMVIQDFLDDDYKKHVIPFAEFDSFIDNLKPKIQSKPLRTINKLSSVGVI